MAAGAEALRAGASCGGPVPALVFQDGLRRLQGFELAKARRFGIEVERAATDREFAQTRKLGEFGD